MAKTFGKIALLGRVSDSRVRDSLQGLAPHLADRGAEVLAADDLDIEFTLAPVTRVDEQALASHADLVIAVGGDGTMLYAARLVAGHEVPVLGVNRGRLGFLADVTPDEMLHSIDEVMTGNYSTEKRLMLQAEVLDNDVSVIKERALNDVVVQKWHAGRMLEFETYVDGVYVNSHSSDGLIVASPTGSTAYALSCNGPIVQPELDALILVPISPHTLSDRPIAIPATRTVEVRLLEREETLAQLMCDGQAIAELGINSTLRVSAAAERLHLIHPPGYDYYRILRSKLQWGRGSSGGPGKRRGRD